MTRSFIIDVCGDQSLSGVSLALPTLPDHFCLFSFSDMIWSKRSTSIKMKQKRTYSVSIPLHTCTMGLWSKRWVRNCNMYVIPILNTAWGKLLRILSVFLVRNILFSWQFLEVCRTYLEISDLMALINLCLLTYV